MTTLLLTLFTLPAIASADQVYDRKLTQAEMDRLLPRYVALVDANKAEVPSPADKQALWGAVSMIANPHYAFFRKDEKGNLQIIGLQTHKAQTIIDGVAAAAREAQAITVKERVESTDQVLEGFRSPSGKKISCRLGFGSSAKSPTERLVKCVDDRSVKGDWEEEYFEQRIFILSIDGKTLEPIAVYDIEHPAAG